MAIYHCSIKNIGRSSGKSAVNSIAYRLGEKLHDEELDKYFDYTNKTEVIYSNTYFPDNSEKFLEKIDALKGNTTEEKLWNEVQRIEKSKDARFAKEIEVAIPNELSKEQAIELINKFSENVCDNNNTCVTYAIHWKEGNHHAHIVTTARSIDVEKGDWSAKSKKVYELDESGNKIPLIDKNTGLQKVDKSGRKQWKNHKEDYNNLNKKEWVEDVRKDWELCCNESLKKAQIKEKVSCQSFRDLGKEELPTIHEGYKARDIERRGGTSELCQRNRDIKEHNSILARIKTLKQNLENIIIEKYSKYFADLESQEPRQEEITVEPEETNEELFDRAYEASQSRTLSLEFNMSDIDRLNDYIDSGEYQGKYIEPLEKELKEINEQDIELRRANNNQRQIISLESSRNVLEDNINEYQKRLDYEQHKTFLFRDKKTIENLKDVLERYRVQKGRLKEQINELYASPNYRDIRRIAELELESPERDRRRSEINAALKSHEHQLDNVKDFCRLSKQYGSTSIAHDELNRKIERSRGFSR